MQEKEEASNPQEEIIDVTEIIDRIEKLEKEVRDFKEDAEKRITDCEDSIDALGGDEIDDGSAES